jgi:hypothetical protein
MRLFICLLIIVLTTGMDGQEKQPGKESAKQETKKVPADPAAALSAVKEALEKADVVAYANLAAGPPGAIFRKLAGPLKKVQDASEKLDRAIAEKPALNVINPFANQLNPLVGYQIEIIELFKEGNQQLSRVRFGLANQLKEETLLIAQEDGQWRVSLPGEFLKSANRLTPERLSKQIDTLSRLADILTNLAGEVSSGKLATREAVMIKLAAAVKDAKLTEAQPGSDAKRNGKPNPDR